MGTISLDGSFLLAVLPLGIMAGGFIVATYYRINPVQRHRDAMIQDTLAAAEKRIAQLVIEVNNLEAQVQRLREDLAYERGLTRELREANLSLSTIVHESSPE